MERRCVEIRDAKSIYPLFLFPHPSKGRSPILTMVSLHSAPYLTPIQQLETHGGYGGRASDGS